VGTQARLRDAAWERHAAQYNDRYTELVGWAVKFGTAQTSGR